MIYDRLGPTLGPSLYLKLFFVTKHKNLAAVMLRFAFPHKIYAERENTQVNPTNTSDNFRSVMNPRDMWSDTVKNFAPSYSNYAHIDEGDNVSRSEQPI